MSRSRAYTRDVARRKALHRKYISDQWFYDGRSWYPKLGYYRKGKIHRSYGIHMNKTRNKGHRRLVYANNAPSINYKYSDLTKKLNMDEQEREYLYGI